GTTVKSVCVKRSSCSWAASRTRGWPWPTLRQPTPPAKSMNVLPSTSVIVAPFASAATTGKVICSGEATEALKRSRISRERGPGTAVFSSIARVAATPARVPERSGRRVGAGRHDRLYTAAGACPQPAAISRRTEPARGRRSAADLPTLRRDDGSGRPERDRRHRRRLGVPRMRGARRRVNRDSAGLREAFDQPTCGRQVLCAPHVSPVVPEGVDRTAVANQIEESGLAKHL